MDETHERTNDKSSRIADLEQRQSKAQRQYDEKKEQLDQLELQMNEGNISWTHGRRRKNELLQDFSVAHNHLIATQNELNNELLLAQIGRPSLQIGATTLPQSPRKKRSGLPEYDQAEREWIEAGHSPAALNRIADRYAIEKVNPSQREAERIAAHTKEFGRPPTEMQRKAIEKDIRSQVQQIREKLMDALKKRKKARE